MLKWVIIILVVFILVIVAVSLAVYFSKSSFTISKPGGSLFSGKKVKISNLEFIHIGKCGGTTVQYIFGMKEWHHQKPVFNHQKKYVIWIRDPCTRFVSAFYFAKDLVELDLKTVKNIPNNKLTLDNVLSESRVKHKRKHGFTFNKRYDYLLRQFNTANDLAESLSSLDTKKKGLADELMSFPIEHISKGIGWYLNDGDFVKKHHKNIYFVGQVENPDDYQKLADKLGVKYDKKNEHIRKNTNSHDKSLSETAKANLKEFYKGDYRAIKMLKKYKKI